MDICKSYGLRSKTQLRNWIRVYNGHKEFRATRGQGREIYMAKERLTTLDERIEIVSYCLAKGKDYGAAIEKYGVSYQQTYSWVRKYEQKGVSGLIDKRGKCKPLDEMTQVERLQAEQNAQGRERIKRNGDCCVKKL